MTEADSVHPSPSHSQSRDSTRPSLAYVAPRLNVVALKYASKSAIRTSPRVPGLTGMARSLSRTPDASRLLRFAESRVDDVCRAEERGEPALGLDALSSLAFLGLTSSTRACGSWPSSQPKTCTSGHW